MTSLQPELIATIIAISSLFLSIYTAYLQRKNNILSVRPLCYIKNNNYENDLAVKICNYGIGPLIIQKIVISLDNQEIGCSLIQYISQEMQDTLWTDYVENISGRTIPTGGEIILIRLACEDYYDKPPFTIQRERLRKLLQPLSIEVVYKDVYDKEYNFSRSLDFFGGHL
jgi:hypothetical protein